MIAQREPVGGRPGGLFFTGTDTGVGKTHVTAGVARLLRQQGRAVRVCKPLATGAARRGGGWVSDDTLRLAEAAGQGVAEVTAWAFCDPVAPSVAVRRAGLALPPADIARAVRRQERPGAAMLVEGVGGLLCPLVGRHTVADLAAAVGFPLVVVARRSLGTLSHTLLTLEVARTRGLAVAGVVVNETEPPGDLAAETNVSELGRLLDVPLLAVVPHRPGTAAPEILAKVDWWRLCFPEPAAEPAPVAGT